MWTSSPGSWTTPLGRRANGHNSSSCCSKEYATMAEGAIAHDGPIFIAALFGAASPGPTRIGDIDAVPVTWNRWRFLEKTDVADEMAGQWIFAEALDQEPAVQPPSCLITTSEP